MFLAAISRSELSEPRQVRLCMSKIFAMQRRNQSTVRNCIAFNVAVYSWSFSLLAIANQLLLPAVDSGKECRGVLFYTPLYSTIIQTSVSFLRLCYTVTILLSLKICSL